MDIFAILMKLFSLVMMILFIGSTVLLIFTFRKPKKLSVSSLLITIVISLVTLVVFSALTKYEPALWVWLLMGIIGLAIGLIQAKTTKIYIKNNKIMSQNSIWYLVAWGSIFALNQLLTIITNKPPDMTMALLIIGTTTTWGTSADIMRRFYKTRAGIPNLAKSTTVNSSGTATKSDSISEPQAVLCPGCHNTIQPDDCFCSKCGRSVTG